MKSSHYDVIIVGAGPAGSAAGLDLASAGMRVLLLDKHDFPRMKPCAGGVTIKAVQRLRYDISPVVRESVSTLRMSLYQRRHADFSADSAAVLMTHRPELDQLALEQALQAGAEFQRCRHIQALNQHNAAVTLVTDDAQFSGRWLIAADGANSRIRRLVLGHAGNPGAMAIEGLLPREQCREYPLTGFDFGVLPGGYGWVFPKGDHVNVGLYAWRQGGTQINRQALAEYARARLGSDALEHVQGFPIATAGAHWSPVAGRVLFAGDAAGLAEPLLGEGIYGAILSGQKAAMAILAEQDVAGDYQRALQPWRDELQRTHQLSRLWYGTLPIAFGLLKYAAGGLLVRGFADGLTLGGIKRRAVGRRRSDV